jgi:citrate lyase beta subunit
VAWFIALLIAVVLTAVSYVLMPKPKQPKPAAAQQADDPVAEAGKPVGVVQGTITISELNVLWFGEKALSTYKINV